MCVKDTLKAFIIVNTSLVLLLMIHFHQEGAPFGSGLRTKFCTFQSIGAKNKLVQKRTKKLVPNRNQKIALFVSVWTVMTSVERKQSTSMENVREKDKYFQKQNKSSQEISATHHLAIKLYFYCALWDTFRWCHVLDFNGSTQNWGKRRLVQRIPNRTGSITRSLWVEKQ